MLALTVTMTACEQPQAESQIRLPAPESAGAQMVKKYCSDCHAPPSPQVHVAKEWPNVVYRMQERRRMKAFELIKDDEKVILINYLQTFSRR